MRIDVEARSTLQQELTFIPARAVVRREVRRRRFRAVAKRAKQAETGFAGQPQSILVAPADVKQRCESKWNHFEESAHEDSAVMLSVAIAERGA